MDYGMAADAKKCDEVWRRILPQLSPYPDVRDGDTSGSSTEALPKIEITGETIAGFIADEAADRCTYLALAKAAKSKAAAKCLFEIAKDEGEHAKKLKALYYIITGQCYSETPVKQPRIITGQDVLRQRYEGEREGAKQYMTAAASSEDGRQRALFLCLADDEARHGDIIWRMLINSRCER